MLDPGAWTTTSPGWQDFLRQDTAALGDIIPASGEPQHCSERRD